VKWFKSGTNFLMYVDLLMALTPVVVSIYTHHMVKQAATMPTRTIHAAVLRRELMTTPQQRESPETEMVQAIPWSLLGPEFATVWGGPTPMTHSRST